MTDTVFISDLQDGDAVSGSDWMELEDAITGEAFRVPVEDFTLADVHALIGGRHTVTGLTTGQPLRATSTTAIAFGPLDLANANAITGDLPFANLTQIAGLSVLGVTGNATADVAAITAGTDGHVLRRSGTAIGFGTITVGGALAPGTARQLIQTNAGATAAEWASNIDIPGTLDVTGAAVFDATILVGAGITLLPTRSIYSALNGASNFVESGSFGTGFEGAFVVSNSRGTSASPTATQSGDILGSYYFQGYDTSPSKGARIYAVAAGEWGTAGDSSDSPTDLYFAVCQNTSGTLFDRLILYSTGAIAVSGTPLSLGAATTTINFSSSTGPHTISSAGATDIAISPGSKKILFVSTGVLDWGAGNYTLTHSTGLLTASGALTIGGAITTSAPTTGTAKPWKLGNIITGQVGLILLATQYVELDILGTLYRLATV